MPPTVRSLARFHKTPLEFVKDLPPSVASKSAGSFRAIAIAVAVANCFCPGKNKRPNMSRASLRGAPLNTNMHRA